MREKPPFCGFLQQKPIDVNLYGKDISVKSYVFYYRLIYWLHTIFNMAEDKKENKKDDVKKPPSFLLRDANLRKISAQGTLTRWGDVNLGKCVVVHGLDQGGKFDEGGINLNPTGVGGSTQNMFYGMSFEIGKDAWERVKGDEWIETGHANPEYHQMILGQKATYEDKMKLGLAGISQSVADLELLEHDVRKYEEYKGYLGDLDSDDEKKKRAATFAIKTIFVDQVDFHAGGGGQGAGRLSLAFMRNNNIMPTIVNDFLMMESLDDIREGGKFVNMADVEKKMLESKWTLYEHWLGVFRSAIMQRLERIEILRKSREFTIGQFRDWLKPIIMRYRLIETAYAKPTREGPVQYGRKDLRRHHVFSVGMGVSYNGWTMWFYKPLTNPEQHTYAAELRAKAILDGEYGKQYGYDKWTQDHLIFDKEHGLIADYPWIRKGWVDEKVEDISAFLQKKRRDYYSFATVDICKVVTKGVTGTLTEDTDFFFNMYVLSANIVLMKKLEIEAKNEDLEVFLDKMLGLPPGVEKKYDGEVIWYKKMAFGYEVDSEKFKTKKAMLKKYPDPEYYLTPINEESKSWNDFKNLFGLDLWLFKKRGPYEHQFYDRFTKYYLKLSGQRFNTIVDQIMKRMKIEDVS